MEMNKVLDRNSCAYKEIYEILKIFPSELVNKVPKDKIEFFYKNMDNNYKYNISKETFDGQTMLEETAAILTILFRDYWATPEQKTKLENFTENAQKVMEEESREKYNPDNIFKNKKEEAVVENTNLPVEIKKETFFKKLISFIKGLFNKTN